MTGGMHVPAPHHEPQTDVQDVSGATGTGLELTKMLYAKNGTVYIATRSLQKIQTAIETIRDLHPSSQGQLHALVLDLADLRSIKPAAMKFRSQEERLDVLFHNAGVMGTSTDAKSAQVWLTARFKTMLI